MHRGIRVAGALRHRQCTHFGNSCNTACFHGNPNASFTFPCKCFRFKDSHTFCNRKSSRKMSFHSQIFDSGKLVFQHSAIHLSYFWLSQSQVLKIRSIGLVPFSNASSWPLVFSFKGASQHHHTCLLSHYLIHFLLEQGIAPTRSWLQIHLKLLWWS